MKEEVKWTRDVPSAGISGAPVGTSLCGPEKNAERRGLEYLAAQTRSMLAAASDHQLEGRHRTADGRSQGWQTNKGALR